MADTGYSVSFDPEGNGTVYWNTPIGRLLAGAAQQRQPGQWEAWPYNDYAPTRDEAIALVQAHYGRAAQQETEAIQQWQKNLIYPQQH